MKVYFGLGSNEGDRLKNLEMAVMQIQKLGRKGSTRISSIYETPALLPEKAPSTWNQPFLNLALQTEIDSSPLEILYATQKIEKTLGRALHEKWAPRTIDIDLLLWGDEKLESPELSIPHPRMMERSFVLDPLKDLNPKFLLAAKKLPQHAPVWMGVINLTPDSFSDGGTWTDSQMIENRLHEWDQKGVGIFDIGGESTRPGARPVDLETEWSRIKSLLDHLQSRYRGKALRPLISVDTYHVKTATLAIEKGADIINDVSGLADLNLLKVLRDSKVQYVLMHSLGVPVQTGETLPALCDPVSALTIWFKEKTALLENAGITRDRIILDPGIGFGKTSLQSLEIIRNLDRFQSLPYRMLIGHSRKSFLTSVTSLPGSDRDFESIGISINLVSKGADILRVHNPLLHMRAFGAWNHANRSTP